ncbi:MAG: ribokinase, partial [Candidatus Hydrogenedentes bacterium]|nr:ribokinase [Candidatus Hydrogenedentota bacterium]
PTGTAVILVAETGQNSIVVVPAANLGIRPEDIAQLEPIMASFDALLLQLEIPLDTVEAALELARKAGVLTILDAGPAQQIPDSLIRSADIVSPNETEAEALTGIAVENPDDARRAAEKLLARGARMAVMKLGAQGALYCGDRCFHVPAFPITPVDTTAAGDAFTAALACAWKRLSPHEALQFANAAGALAATVAGAQPSMPSFDRVEAFLRERGVSL